MSGEAPRPPNAPGWALPPDSCDCHAHVFGPYDRFPAVNVTHYEPPRAPAAAHVAMLERCGLSRGVLIQPALYGTRPDAIIGALKQARGLLRGIAVADATVDDASLERWHAAGIRGLRFIDMTVPDGSGPFVGSVPSTRLAQIAPKLRELGWHAEIWARIDQHAAQLSRYRDSGVPIVLDHLAGVVPARGIADPDFQAVCAALREGWLWVKLALCRCSQDFPDYRDLRPFHDALVDTNSHRLVWGSDWPHLRLADKTPDVGHLLDLLRAWVGDETKLALILAANPAALYNFR